MDQIIEMDQLTLTYGKKPALTEFTASLNDNRLIGLIGRNGSGKTTLMKLCAGLLEPTDGSIRVFGENPVDRLNILSEVMYSYPEVPHRRDGSLYESIQNFAMFYPRFDENFALKLLDLFSLNSSMKYKSLSQGMASTFNFICAIASRAKLTLLDEPVLGMDVIVRKRVYEIILRDYMEYPRTIIISSHILSEIEDILSEILLIDSGRIVFYKDMEEVRSMAYRIDGAKEKVEAFSSRRTVIYEEHKTIGSYAIIEDQCDETTVRECMEEKLTLSRVRPEDLCIYKTIHGRGQDIECLWEKQTL